MGVPGHGVSEGIGSSRGAVDRVAIFVHFIDLAQCALRCAEDEATGLGYVDLNLCSKLNNAVGCWLFLFLTIAVIHE